jgi:hypothetical protein
VIGSCEVSVFVADRSNHQECPTALIERVNVRVDQINIQMRPTGLSALFDTAVTPSLREETAILSVPAPPA